MVRRCGGFRPAATQSMNLADQAGETRARRLEKEFVDRGSDDFLTPFVEGAMPLGPSTFTVHEVGDGSAGLKDLYQAISRRHAHTEFIGEAANIAGCRAMLSTPQESADDVGAAPRDVPLFLVDLVRKGVGHQSSGGIVTRD